MLFTVYNVMVNQNWVEINVSAPLPSRTLKRIESWFRSRFLTDASAHSQPAQSQHRHKPYLPFTHILLTLYAAYPFFCD